MKKTFIQSAVVWLLAFMIVAAVFAAVSLHDSSTVFAATSGSCGSNTEFNIDADGVMTISGTGTITQQSSYSKYSWYADRAKVKKLIISEGVTNMPNNAFYGMTNLTNVQLPSTISTWGTTVFGSGTNSAGITTLTIAGGAGFIIDQGIIYDKDKTRLVMALRNATGEVNLPASLKSIDTNGMEGCAEVTSISLPEGLETIGAYAFRDVSKIKSIKIPATVTALPNYLFSGCSSLETVELHNGITSIGTYLFDNCTSLGSITVPDGIKTLGGNMFKGCTSLKNVSLPGELTTLSGNTFNGCTSLEEIALPETVTKVGASEFNGCTSLTKVNIPSGLKILGASATSSSIFSGCSSLEEIKLPNGLTTIGASAFKGCTSLKDIDIPATVTTIGSMAFQQCTSLEEITVPEGVTTLTATFAGCSSLEKIILPSTLTTLTAKSTNAPGVFSECTGLEEITIPEKVKLITMETFNGCTSLKTLGISEGVTTIGQSAYKGCTSLEDITIPSTVTSVVSGAFENCTGLMKVRLGEGMKQFGGTSQCFVGCDRLTDLYFPDSLTTLNPAIFEKATSIQTIHLGEDSNFAFKGGVLYDKAVTKLIYVPACYSGTLVLPETVVETASRVAGYTHALTKVVFPEGFKTVGSSAFYYADGLKEVELPSTLETIGQDGFRSTGLRSVVIPDSVTSIGTNAFTRCDYMTYAHVGEGVKTLPGSCFFNCYALEKVDLPSGLETIDSRALYGIMVPEIVVPEGCKTIAASAFANNGNLNSVILPASLTSIPKTAFDNDKALNYIYYKGTADQWAAFNCTPAFGTVITDYKGTDEELAPAVIATQPESAVYKKGEEPKDLAVKIQPTGTAGEQYFYTWYKNTTGETDAGTTVAGTAIENGMSCKPTTDKIGTEFFYCVVTRMVNGYTAEKVISNVVQVTVKMDLDGSGTEKDPFMLKTADDMMLLYNTVKEGNTLSGAYLKMANDIELPEGWDPIGTLKDGKTGSEQGKGTDPFSGVFDGGGYTIKIPEGGKPLFGYVRNATIRNLNIYGVKIDGTGLVDHYERDYEAGSSQSEFGSDAKFILKIENVTLKKGTKTRESGFIGDDSTNEGKITQDASSMNPVLVVSCKAEEGVEIGYNKDEHQIGTFVGRVCGTVINCTSSADVYGVSRVGGIAGCQDVAMGILHVINSSFHGTVHATGDMAGGILGTGYRGSAPNALCVEIRNCYADGKVEGRDMVGGIMGAEDEVAQCWGNGIGYIYSNLFAGTIKASEDAKYVGGTVGYYRSLNKYTNFANNVYKEGCGATRGIGGVQYVDTNAKNHETEIGDTYFNTENGTAGLPYVQFCDWKAEHNRTDDPLGADADAISYKATSAELAAEDKMLKKLNEDTTSMHNWVMGGNGYPVLSDKVICYQLTLSGAYKDEYEIGDKLDLSGMKFTAAWTDGSETEPEASDITFSGFDSQKRGYQIVKATYGAGTTEFKVKVLLPDHGEKITVSFSMYGDDEHGEAETPHTMKMGTLQKWIEKKDFQVSLNATAFDVLQMALDEKGWKARVNGGYVAGIVKDGNELAEKDNGADSGWMYTLNGVHSQNMLPEQFLMDGDEIVFHYTDEYPFEEDALDVSDVKELIAIINALPDADKVTEEHGEAVARANELMKGLKDNKDKLVSQDRKNKLDEVTQALSDYMIDKAEQAISDITGTTIEDEESVAAARAAYDELTPEQQDKVPAEYVVKLLNAEQKIDKAKQEKAAQEAAEQAEKERQEREAAEAAAKELAQARDKALVDIQEYADLMIDKADANNLRIVVLEAKDQLKSANDQKTIDAVVENAKNAIDDLVQAQADAEEAAAKKELDDAKADAASVVALVKADDYVDADKAKVEAAIQAAGAALETAKTTADVEAALRAFNEAVSACKTKEAEAAEQAEEAAKELAKTRKDSINSINQYYDAHANGMYEDDRLKAQVTVLSQILFISSAENKNDIAAAVKKATDDIDARVAFKTKTEAAKAAAKNYKVKSLKVSAKNKKFTVTWQKASNETGYQVQYKTKKAKKFSNLKKSTTALKVTTKKLKEGQKYIFRVRTYKTINGAKVYGKWVKTKAVKCK